MLNKPIWALTASELCKRIKNNELSATEITFACLEQTKKVNPQLNAIVDDMSDEAIKRAESLDSAVAAGKPKGRLFGVPVTVKINVDQKGYATSNGVTALKNFIAKTNAPIVDHLMDAVFLVKDQGFKILAADEKSEKQISGLSLKNKTVIILGSEGKGISPPSLKKCDDTFGIRDSIRAWEDDGHTGTDDD